MSLPLEPGNYVLDVAHSQVSFSVKHLGITAVRGLFTSFSGGLTVGDNAEASSLTATVDLTSVQSGNAMRDEHLQAPDFFDTASAAEMSFRSTALVGNGDQWSVQGELTLKGVTAPITLAATLTGRAVHPMDQKQRIGVAATGVVNRSTFKVAPAIPAMVLPDDIAVALDLELMAA